MKAAGKKTVPKKKVATLRDRIKDFRRVHAKELLRNKLNWRRHPAAQRAALRGILDEIGFAGALLARETPEGLELIDGHLRVEENPDAVFPILVTDLTEEEAKKLLLTLDPIAAMAETDTAALGELLNSVSFDDAAINDMIGKMMGAAITKPEPVKPPEEVDRLFAIVGKLQKKWKTKHGQVWRIGDGLMMCGSCTSSRDVAKLMGKDKASLCFTSPPYAAQRDYDGNTKSQLKDWTKLLTDMAINLPLTNSGQLLVNLGLVHENAEWQAYWQDWFDWLRTQKYKRFGWYVWDQMHGLRGDWFGRLAPSHEFVFHFCKEFIHPQKWIECLHAGEQGGGMRSPDGKMRDDKNEIQSHKIMDSVIRVQRQKGGIPGHPAPFSVPLCEAFLNSWLGLVYEPFSGSGTMLVACHGLKRACRAMEKSPAYCAVALERWSEYAEQKAVLV